MSGLFEVTGDAQLIFNGTGGNPYED